MEILKFENAPAPRKSAAKKSNLKSLAGLATVAAVAVLGSTLAANITLGAGTLEFGQGVQVTAACDTDITLSPQVTFKNGASPLFMLSTVSFSGIDAQADKCRGKTFTLSAYGETSATPVQMATSPSSTAITEATIAIASDGNSVTTTAGTVAAGLTGGAGANLSFNLGFTTPSATNGAVAKLTLQSK